MRRAPDLLLALLLLAAPSFAELTPEQRKTAEGLIGEFSSDDIEVRKKACEDLAKMGPDVIALIDETIGKTEDPEVRRRCDMTLKAIERDCVIVRRDGKIAEVVDLRPSRVTIDAKEKPLSEIVEELAKQSGNGIPSLKVLAEAGRARIVTFKAEDLTWWQALDALCRQERLLYDSAWWTHEALNLEPAAKMEPLAAYPGPGVVYVTGIRRDTHVRVARVFRTTDAAAAEQEGNAIEERTVHIELKCAVEDRLPTLGTALRIDSVIGADGKKLFNRRDAGAREAMRLDWRRRTWADGRVDLEDEGGAVAGPLTVNGALGIQLTAGKRELRVDDIFGKEKPAKVELGGMTVTVNEVTRKDETVKLDMSIERGIGAPGRVLSGRDGPFGFRLISPDGVSHDAICGYGWRSESMSANGTGEGIDINIRLDEADRGKLSLEFIRVPQDKGKWSLVYAFPERIETREFPFTITDIPLP